MLTAIGKPNNSNYEQKRQRKKKDYSFHCRKNLAPIQEFWKGSM